MKFCIGVVLAFAVAANVSAQLPPAQRTIPANVTRLPLKQFAGSIEIRFNPPAPSDWLVGVRVEPGATAELQVCEMTHADVPWRLGASITRPGAFLALAAERVSEDQGVIRVSPSQTRDATLLVYVIVPATANVTIGTESGKTSVGVTESVIVRNGAILSTPLQGLHKLQVLATSTFTGRTASVGPVNRSGRYFVNWSALREHLRAYVAPKLPLSPSNETSTIFVRIVIGPDGVVSRVEGLPADPRFSDVETTIRGWSFLPFAYAGKPVEVVGQLTLLITSDGKVGSPLDPSATQ